MENGEKSVISEVLAIMFILLLGSFWPVALQQA